MANIGQPMSYGIYTVKRGKEQEFIQEWQKAAQWTMGQYNFTGVGARLYQDTEDPQRYISYGEWNSLNDIKAWSQRPEYQGMMDKLRDLCDHMERRVLKLAFDMPVGQVQQEKIKTR
jgi:heme-degrading monooxygenase HmoA